MRDFYKNIEEHNPSRKCNALIYFDDMVVDRLGTKNLIKLYLNYIAEVESTFHLFLSHNLISKYQKMLD